MANKLFYAFGSGLRNKTTTYNTSRATTRTTSPSTYWNSLISSSTTSRVTSHTTSYNTLASSKTTSRTTYKTTSYSTLSLSRTTYRATSKSTTYKSVPLSITVTSSSLPYASSIIGYYKTYLHRYPDLPGLTNWSNRAVSEGLSVAQAGISSSVEAMSQSVSYRNNRWCGGDTYVQYFDCNKTTSYSSSWTTRDYSTTSKSTGYTTSWTTYSYGTTSRATNYSSSWNTFAYRTTSKVTSFGTNWTTTYSTEHVTSQV